MITFLKNHRYKLASLLLFIVTVVYLKPVYDFYGHRGKVPLSPFGWSPVPVDAPVTEVLHAADYRAAASNVLKAMEKRRTDIGAASYSIAVGIKGKLLWSGAVGWSNFENKIKATPETIYRIGSTSKAVTSTALARLVDKGIIDLDQTIDAYMTDLPNESWNAITPRMLVSHMSGIAHYAQKGVEKDYAGLYQVIALTKHYDDMSDALEIFNGTSLRSEPGTEFYYSSQGTVLLGAVMSAAADKPYLQIIREEVLGPNAMVSTIVSPVESDGSDHIATSYLNRMDGDVHQMRPWRAVDLSHRLPGGGFAATSSDLVRMGMATLDPDYIKSETIAAFWTSQTLASGEVNNQNYALGWRYREWEVDGVGLVKNVNHGGVSRGAQSWLLVLPEHDMAIAINANIKTKSFADFGMIYQDVIKAFTVARP